jgi:hypothetical protein
VKNAVFTITGTNFDENNIVDIDIAAAPVGCTGISSYIVTSPTTIVVKTPTAGCTASVDQVNGETITINETGGVGTLSNVPATAAQRLIFVPPPEIDLLANKPVITDASSQLATANQVVNLIPAGNQTIRVKALGSYRFDQRTTAGLSASLGGKPLTAIAVYNTTGTATGPTGIPDADGNWFTAKSPVPLVAGGAYSLTVTQFGVSKTFAQAATGLTWNAVPTAASLDVKEGKAAGGTTVKVTGTGFSTTVADYNDGSGNTNVKVCGTEATVTAATATLITFTTPDVGNVAAPAGLGLTVYSGVCPVTVTDAAGGVSPLTANLSFAYLAN